MDNRMLGWRRVILSVIKLGQPHAKNDLQRSLAKANPGNVASSSRNRSEGGDGKQEQYPSPSKSYLLALGPRWTLHTQGGHHFHCLFFDGLCLGYGIVKVASGESLLSLIPHLGDFGETCLDSVELRLI
jgi:hypothetical protein